MLDGFQFVRKPKYYLTFKTASSELFAFVKILDLEQIVGLTCMIKSAY